MLCLIEVEYHIVEPNVLMKFESCYCSCGRNTYVIQKLLNGFYMELRGSVSY